MRLWLLAALLVAFLAGTLARRGSKQGKNGCRYKKGTWSECDTDSNTQTRVMSLKRGNDTVCQNEVTETRLCKVGRASSPGKRRNRMQGHKGRRRGGGKKRGSRKGGCQYSKGEWADCDPVSGMKSRLLTLESGDPKICEATKIKTKKCRIRARSTSGCKYSKDQWSQCDAIHDVKTRVMTLKEGSPSSCPQSYSLTKACRQGSSCVYTKSRWGECDPLTYTQTSVRLLQPNSPAACNSTLTFIRKCRARATRKASRRKNQGRSGKCRYTKGKWSACDGDNVQRRSLSLRMGDPVRCNMTLEERPCKAVCKYIKGTSWSQCDPVTNEKKRTDTLKEGSSVSCNATRVKTRPCRAATRNPDKCVYDKGSWSECNSEQKRIFTKTLLSGGPQCLKTKTRERSCLMRNGQVKCFYGPWGTYGECQNGVRKKTREILSGGEKCQRKAVKMKSCSV